MLTDVAGLFFPHLWPLGLPQRESSSLELVQNCQMLPPEHSCISVHTIHTTSYFLTLFFWFIQTRPFQNVQNEDERSQPVTSQWNEVPKFHGSQISYDFQWMFARSRRRGQNETTFSGANAERPFSKPTSLPSPNQPGQRFKQRVMVNPC